MNRVARILIWMSLLAGITSPVLLRECLAEDGIQLESILLDAESQRIDAIARAVPSAVSVFVPGGGGGGSGVLISPEGYALTNFHVSSPAGSFMRCGLNDGQIYDAVIVGIDPVGDLAMIRLLGRDDFPYAELGDSNLARPGDWCMVIGNPFLLASNLQPTVTWGILSGVGRYQYPSGTLLEYGDCLQTDASINPGNSGGPLYDASGRLLGIVGRASFEKRGRVNVGVGYAISVQQAKNFLGALRSGRIVDHATLGATVATEPDGGVRISNVLESSDAYRRGLRYGAEILEIDGRVVQTANEVQKVLATLPSGWRVSIRYRSEGETKSTLVRLMGVHREDELLEKMAAALPPPPPRPQPKPEETPQERDGPAQPDLGEGLEGLKDAEEGGPKTPEKFNKQVRDPKIPEKVADQLIDRRGYANYYFNQRQQELIYNELIDQAPVEHISKASTWTVVGTSQGDPGVPFRCVVSRDGMRWELGDESTEFEGKNDFYEAINSRSASSVIAALDGWRRLLREGPKKFGETYYFGSVPLYGERPLRDCLIGNDGELEIRWLTHPDTGQLEAMEVFADRDLDPLEVRFGYQDEAGNLNATPTSMDLRFGVDSLLKLKIDQWESEPGEESQEAPEGEEVKLPGSAEVSVLPVPSVSHDPPGVSFSNSESGLKHWFDSLEHSLEVTDELG